MQVERSGRPAVGDTVRVEGWGACEVIDNSDPSIVRLRITRSGREVKVGERALAEMLNNDGATVLSMNYPTDNQAVGEILLIFGWGACTVVRNRAPNIVRLRIKVDSPPPVTSFRGLAKRTEEERPG